jgi:hypothetical protein
MRINADLKPGVTGLHHIDNAGGLTVWDEKKWHSAKRFWRSAPNKLLSDRTIGSGDTRSAT